MLLSVKVDGISCVCVRVLGDCICVYMYTSVYLRGCDLRVVGMGYVVVYMRVGSLCFSMIEVLVVCVSLWVGGRD